MKIGLVALKIRAGDTMFANRVAGAVEMAVAQNATLKKDCAFVVQLAELAARNQYDTGINQLITETFGVIVALGGDTVEKDQLGTTAHDKLFKARKQLFSSILGWQMDGTDDDNVASLVSYGGGRFLGFNRAYLWYMFEFTVVSRINDDDGVDEEDTNDFNEIRAQYILAPDGLLPLQPGLPSSLLPATLDQLVNADRGFSTGFSAGFNTLVALANK